MIAHSDDPRDDRLPSRPVRVRFTDDGEEQQTRPKWAGAYQVEMAYGGPEEGGWWVELAIPLGSALIRPDDDPLSVARELWNSFSHLDDGRDVTSVLSSGAVRVYWEDVPGEYAVTQVGRYE